VCISTLLARKAIGCGWHPEIIKNVRGCSLRIAAVQLN
jgi:hypothetical protein